MPLILSSLFQSLLVNWKRLCRKFKIYFSDCDWSWFKNLRTRMGSLGPQPNAGLRKVEEGAAMLRLPGIALTCVLVSSLRSHPLALLLLLLLPLLLLLWPPPAPHGPTQRTGCGQGKSAATCVLFTARPAHLPLTAVSPPPPALPSSVFAVRTAG